MRLTPNQRLALFKACVCNYMHNKPPHGLCGKEQLPPELARYPGVNVGKVRDALKTYRKLEELGLTGWDNHTYATADGMALMRKLLGIEEGSKR